MFARIRQTLIRRSEFESVQLDTDVTINDLRGESLLANLIAQTVSARSDVELPTVPRASQDVSLKAALPQWTAGMRTDPIQDVPFTINIEHGEQATFAGDFGAFSRRKI